MPKTENSLHFVELPELLRQIGEVPKWAIEEGYDPKIDRQVAVFGDEQSLSEWRQEKGLDEERFQIHPAKMGTHIDIYGEAMILNLLAQEEIISTRKYFKEYFQT